MKCFKLTKISRMINPIYLKPQIQNYKYFDHISFIFPPFSFAKVFQEHPRDHVIHLFILNINH